MSRDDRNSEQGSVGGVTNSIDVAALEERLGERMNETLEMKMEVMMGRFSSMLQNASIGGRNQGESSGDGGAPDRGNGDIPPNSRRRSAAVGMTGVSGYGGGFIPQGETAASGGGVGGYGFSGGGAGFNRDGGEEESIEFFSGGGITGSLPSKMMSAPPFKVGASRYPGWRIDFIVHGGFADISEVFLGQGRLQHVTKSKHVLLREGFSSDTIKMTFFAWRFLSDARPDRGNRQSHHPSLHEDKCPSEEQVEHAVLACVVEASDSECDSVENQAF